MKKLEKSENIEEQYDYYIKNPSLIDSDTFSKMKDTNKKMDILFAMIDNVERSALYSN